MRMEDVSNMKPGTLVEYKRNGFVGWYEAEFLGITGRRVCLRLLRYMWPPGARDPRGPVVRVKSDRILRACVEVQA